MQGESERERHEGDGGRALLPIEPTQRCPNPEREPDDEGHGEDESRQTGLGEKLQRDAVRGADVLRVVPDALAGDLERRGSRPARGIRAEHLPGLAPPDGAVVGLQLAEPAGAVDDLAQSS